MISTVASPAADCSAGQTDTAQTGYLQTDGIRVAWGNLDGSGNCALYVLDIASGVETELSQAIAVFNVADGLVVWQEATTSVTTIRTYDGTQLQALQTGPSPKFEDTSDGYVLLEDDGLWQVQGPNGRQLLSPQPEGTAGLSKNFVFSLVDANNDLYVATLN